MKNMNVFSRLFSKKKLVEKQVGDCTIKLKCTDRQLELLDEILSCSASKYENLLKSMESRMSVIENKMDEMLSYFKDLTNGDYGKIVASAQKIAEAKRLESEIEQEKRQIQFNQARRDLSEDEKEKLLMRLFMLIKSDADNLNLYPEMDGGITADFRSAYNRFRAKNGMPPVPSPSVENVRTGTDNEKKNEADDAITEQPSQKKNVKKVKGKRGKKIEKNGKNIGRDRKKEAASTGDAVPSDAKPSNG